MMKKLTSAILAIAMMTTLSVSSFAAGITAEEATQIALKDSNLATTEAIAEAKDDGTFLVKVYIGKASCSYKIDAATGNVISKTLNNAPIK